MHILNWEADDPDFRVEKILGRWPKLNITFGKAELPNLYLDEFKQGWCNLIHPNFYLWTVTSEKTFTFLQSKFLGRVLDETEFDEFLGEFWLLLLFCSGTD